MSARPRPLTTGQTRAVQAEIARARETGLRLVRCGEIPDPPLPSPKEARRKRREIPGPVAPRRAT